MQTKYSGFTVCLTDLADGDIHSILLLIQQLREWHDTMGGSEGIYNDSDLIFVI